MKKKVANPGDGSSESGFAMINMSNCPNVHMWLSATNHTHHSDASNTIIHLEIIKPYTPHQHSEFLRICNKTLMIETLDLHTETKNHCKNLHIVCVTS
jgi:hypothetical protein